MVCYARLGKPNTKKGGIRMVCFSYGKLRGKIKEVFGTQERFADALGISKATLSQKLNNYSEFTQEEMLNAMCLLNQSPSQIDEYFFTLKVRKTE